MARFPHKLVADMHHSNVRFETILHVPTMLALNFHQISDEFKDFLESAQDEKQNKELVAANPHIGSTLSEIKKNAEIFDFANDVASDLYRSGNGFDFLVKLELQVPYDFSFNENNEYLTNSVGNGYITKWIFAKNMKQAAKIAIKQANKLWAAECKKALKAVKKAA